jgi:hypothetical protein
MIMNPLHRSSGFFTPGAYACRVSPAKSLISPRDGKFLLDYRKYLISIKYKNR